MPRHSHLSFGAIMVLHALARGCRYGFDLVDETGLTSGTIYPALDRLETLGYVESEWEDAALAHEEKRPPRRYYSVTPRGAEVLAEALERYKALAPLDLRSLLQGA